MRHTIAASSWAIFRRVSLEDALDFYVTFHSVLAPLRDDGPAVALEQGEGVAPAVVVVARATADGRTGARRETVRGHGLLRAACCRRPPRSSTRHPLLCQLIRMGGRHAIVSHRIDEI